VTTYSCQSGDTWEKLSEKHYGEKDAAEALKEYNRNDPRAAGAILSSGTIASGEKVYIPPLKVLERYGLKLGPTPAPAASAGRMTAPISR
jgi:hypothetical protein